MNKLFLGQSKTGLVTYADVDREFHRILVEEARLREPGIPPECNIFTDPYVARQIFYYLYEVGKSSLVIRGYSPKYGISEPDAQVYESVGGHTNLVLAIAERALSCIYGGLPLETEDGFTHPEIIEAIRIHDLPENRIGDICDDGNRDEAQKRQEENQYLDDFSRNYPIWDQTIGSNAVTLFKEMRPDTDSPTGLLLFLSDKLAAPFMALLLDDLNDDTPPMLSKNNPNASERDRAELELCDFLFDDGFGLMSEMWAIDFFHGRNFAKRDYSGFFTAILVMATLLIHGRWYDWREKDYLAFAETEGEG